jgi:7,8-dihydro-6-hydroxymethylpterin-pyrophosphokinase
LNQPRTIDIDILYFNEDILQQEGLTIPHPRIYKRKFVLVPMQELNASYMDPLHQKSISQLLQECEDELEVRKYDGM